MTTENEIPTGQSESSEASAETPERVVIHEEITETDKGPDDEPQKPASTEDDIKKAFRLHREKKRQALEAGLPEESALVTAEDVKEAAVEQVAEERRPTNEQQPVQQAPQPATSQRAIQPPQSWSVEGKEWFHSLPAQAQQEFARTQGEADAYSTKLWQDLNRETQRAQSINAVIDSYVPKWHSRGITKEQAIAELCAFSDAVSTQPVKTIAGIMQAAGVTPQHIAQFMQSRQAQQVQAPQKQFTERDLQQMVESRIMQVQRTQQEQFAVNSGINDLQPLLHERDRTGRYTYPELWNPQHRERLKPIVNDILKTNPNTGWVDATKLAIATIRQIDGQLSGSPSQSVTKLPQSSQNPQQVIQRAKATAVSVRGRGAPIKNGSGMPLKSTGTTEGDIRAAIEYHRRDS